MLALSWLDRPVSVSDHPKVVLLPVTQVLWVVLRDHPAPAKEYPEVALLPVGLS